MKGKRPSSPGHSNLTNNKPEDSDQNIDSKPRGPIFNDAIQELHFNRRPRNQTASIESMPPLILSHADEHHSDASRPASCPVGRRGQRPSTVSGCSARGCTNVTGPNSSKLCSEKAHYQSGQRTMHNASCPHLKCFDGYCKCEMNKMIQYSKESLKDKNQIQISRFKQTLEI